MSARLVARWAKQRARQGWRNSRGAATRSSSSHEAVPALPSPLAWPSLVVERHRVPAHAGEMAGLAAPDLGGASQPRVIRDRAPCKHSPANKPRCQSAASRTSGHADQRGDMARAGEQFADSERACRLGRRSAADHPNPQAARPGNRRRNRRVQLSRIGERAGRIRRRARRHLCPPGLHGILRSRRPDPSQPLRARRSSSIPPRSGSTTGGAMQMTELRCRLSDLRVTSTIPVNAARNARQRRCA
jgi:hypothetical protein